jgi:peptide/nickel transport system ATP-binding protein
VTAAGPVLEIRDLRLSFRLLSGPVEVLHGISLTVARGERVALVGESGSGKSVTARLVLGLLQDIPGVRIGGTLAFEGRDLARLPARARAALRGRAISMIFQDPTSSLNPVFRIGGQFREVLARATPRIGAAEARATAARLLEEVAIPDPARVLDSYPFQLSGGMNQRVMIAMALANRPALLLADEPGTALDVTVQAQTLDLMRAMVDSHGTAVLFISHNLGVVREFADRTYVIYRGRIVEAGPTATIFDSPGHAYTRALLAAQPRLTGGGLPEIAERDPRFDDPPVIHGGAP